MVATSQPIAACAEHTLVLRRQALAAAMSRAFGDQTAAEVALARMNACAPGTADLDDLRLLERFVSVCEEGALLAEQVEDADWQAGAATFEALADLMRAALLRHL